MKYVILFFLPLIAACQPAALQPQISGKITTENGTPIPGVVVQVVGEQTYNATTDAEGNYSVDVESGSYFVLPYKRTELLNGVDTADAKRIQQHLVGSNLENQWRIFASDANKNGQTTSHDCYIIVAARLGNVQALEALGAKIANGTALHSWWTFCPSDFIIQFSGFSVPAHPEGVTVTATDNVENINFTGFIRGDANGSANPDK